MSSAVLYIPKTRLIWMDCPTPERVETIAAELQWHHEEHYVVWNVSGASGSPPYDPAAFGGRVVSLAFAGHLCPPLLMLVEACASIHAWLRADPANHVAVHCRSGRGRSALVLSCVLAFLAVHGGHGPHSPIDWLSHLAQLRGHDEYELTLPTHRRYLQYFADLLHGGVPTCAGADGCEVRSIVLHGFPACTPPPCVTLSCGTRALFASDDAQDAELPDGMCSYSYHGQGGARRKPGGKTAWPIVRGDVVLTVREESRTGLVICRAGFHAELAAVAGVFRLPCSSLDGAAVRLPPDAFVDIILAARPARPAAGGSGALDAAVESLRIAGAKSAALAGCAPSSAFGGLQPPTPVFSLGDDDDEGEGGDGSSSIGGGDGGGGGGSSGGRCSVAGTSSGSDQYMAVKSGHAVGQIPLPQASSLQASSTPETALSDGKPGAADDPSLGTSTISGISSEGGRVALSPAELLGMYMHKPKGLAADQTSEPPSSSTTSEPAMASATAANHPITPPMPAPPTAPDPPPAVLPEASEACAAKVPPASTLMASSPAEAAVVEMAGGEPRVKALAGSDAVEPQATSRAGPPSTPAVKGPAEQAVAAVKGPAEQAVAAVINDSALSQASSKCPPSSTAVNSSVADSSTPATSPAAAIVAAEGLLIGQPAATSPLPPMPEPPQPESHEPQSWTLEASELEATISAELGDDLDLEIDGANMPSDPDALDAEFEAMLLE